MSDAGDEDANNLEEEQSPADEAAPDDDGSANESQKSAADLCPTNRAEIMSPDEDETESPTNPYIQIIESSGNEISSEQLEECFDHLVKQLNDLKTSDNAVYVTLTNATIDVLRNVGFNQYSTYGHSVIGHNLFILFQQFYILLLRRWRAEVELTDDEKYAFPRLSALFGELATQTNSENGSLFRIMLCNQSLIDELRLYLGDIANDGKHLYKDESLVAVSNILIAIFRVVNELDADPTIEPLLERIANCIASQNCAEILNELKVSFESDELSDAQDFLSRAAYPYLELSYFDTKRLEEVFLPLCKHSLTPFIGILQIYVSSCSTFSESAVTALIAYTSVFLNRDIFSNTNTRTAFNDEQHKLVDLSISALSTATRSPEIIEQCIQYLFMSTLDAQLVVHIKTKNFATILILMADSYEGDIQFNIYRILAAIMTDNDIKSRLSNPSKIASLFVNELRNVTDRSLNEPLKNLLNSLKCK